MNIFKNKFLESHLNGMEATETDSDIVYMQCMYGSFIDSFHRFMVWRGHRRVKL